MGASTRKTNGVIEHRTPTGKIRGECLRAGHSLKDESPATEVGRARDRGGNGEERPVKRVREPKEGSDVVCLAEKENYQVFVRVEKIFTVIYPTWDFMDTGARQNLLHKRLLRPE